MVLIYKGIYFFIYDDVFAAINSVMTFSLTRHIETNSCHDNVSDRLSDPGFLEVDIC